jgi:uncharacterized protein (DUF58 family)
MLPSRRLIIMVLAAAPMFLGGALVPPLTALGVIYLGVLVFWSAVDLLFLPRRRNIAVTRVVPERISVGVPTRVSIEVENRTRRRLLVAVSEALPEGLDADPPECEGEFGSRAEGALTYRLTAHRRGRFELPALDVRVLPFLGLFYRQFRDVACSEVHVFPNVRNVKRHELMLRRGHPYESGLARLRLAGRGTEFESLRLYMPGDEMGHIDWKATARRSALVVRNYEPERQQSVLVVLDVGRATAGEFEGLSRLDYLVNATLMLAHVALRQRDRFSLLAFSDRIEAYLPPVQQATSTERVARALYELQPRLVESDYGAACRFLAARHRRRSLICLMTDVIDRTASSVIIDYLARFARYHLPLAVTIRNPELHALAEQPLSSGPDPYAKAVAIDAVAAREEALTAMRHRGVDVLDVSPHALLPDLINRYVRIKSRGGL